MSDGSMIRLRNGDMAADISPLGAELRALSAAGRELIWTPQPQIWDGTSQVLFPICGCVVDDTVRVNGRSYPMPQHGFALSSVFELIDSTADSCILELRADAATRGHYPYAFVLRLEYRLSATGLSVRARIGNEGDTAMPASLGLHPGFRWPLLPDVPKERHRISFAQDGPIRCARPVNRLAGPDSFQLPLDGQALLLEPSLFEQSGFAVLYLRERSLRYHTDDGRAGIRMEFPDMGRIVLWSRLEGDFLCIEPLLGHADPIGFSGDIMEKPGMAHILPGDNLALSVTITPEFR